MPITMSDWLRRIRKFAAEPARVATDAPTPLASELTSLAEATRKLGRITAKLDLRVESIHHELGSMMKELRAKSDDYWSPLMDALDELDAAREAIESGHVEGAGQGLAGIARRLETLLERMGYRRHAECDIEIDGKLQRVVGTSPITQGQSGLVGRIVRAAVTRGGTVVRTGEVLATKIQESRIEDGQHRD